MGSIHIAMTCAILAAASLYFIFNIRSEASDSSPHRTKLEELMDRRDAIYGNLRDLRFEYRAGKFCEADFVETKRPLEVEAAKVLAEMDELTDGPSTPARRQAAAERQNS